MSTNKTMSGKVKRRVPRLRFPEFREMLGWEVKKLGGITKFSSGNTPSKNKAEFWDGDIPWISASAMHDSRIDSSSYHITTEAVQNGAQIAPQGTILLLVRGSMLHKRIPIGIASREVAFNQDVKSLSIRHDITNTFLLFSLISKERRLLNSVTKTGIGAGKLDTNELKALEVEIPNKKEQQKIADCLSSVDALIGLQGRKVEQLARHKQALLQQLFPADGDDCMDAGGRATQDAKAETTPRLRFPEYRTAPAWEEKRLGDFMSESRIVGSKGDVAKKLTVKLWGKGVFAKNDEIKGSQNTQYYRRKAGQIIYSKLDFLNQAFGVIPEELEGYESTIDLPAFDVSEEASEFFILEYIKRKDFFLKVGEVADGSRKAKRIHPETFLSYPVYFPKKEEQQKIANCLSSLDTLINLNRRKLEALKRHKQGLMQQLFPAEEEA